MLCESLIHRTAYTCDCGLWIVSAIYLQLVKNVSVAPGLGHHFKYLLASDPGFQRLSPQSPEPVWEVLRFISPQSQLIWMDVGEPRGCRGRDPRF